MAKAICRVGGHRVIGFDRAEAVLAEALKMQAIGEVGTEEQISTLDMILLALYPKDSIAFIEQHAHCISKECIAVSYTHLLVTPEVPRVQGLLCLPPAPFSDSSV